MEKTLQIKVKNRGNSEGCAYKNEINLKDASLLALVLQDLQVMFDAPIQKACQMVLKNKEKSFPFG